MKSENKRTHTIRWNGNKASRIIKFTDYYMTRLKESYPESVSLIITMMKKYLKSLTGKNHEIDSSCMSELEKTFPEDILVHDYDHSTHLISQCFQNGYLSGTMHNVDKDLDFINNFYRMIKEYNNGKV